MSKFEVIVLNPFDVAFIFNSLKQDISIEDLSQNLTDLGLSHLGSSQIRKLVVELKSDIGYSNDLELLNRCLRKALGESNDNLFHYLKSRLEYDVVNDEMNLFWRIFYAQYPVTLRRIENYWRFPETGNLNSLIQNYQERFYTRRIDLSSDGRYCRLSYVLENRIHNAVKWNHYDMIERMISLNYDLDCIMEIASKYSRVDIVKLTISSGCTNFNRSLRAAAKEGYFEIVEIMLDHGAGEYGTVMVYSARAGRFDLVNRAVASGRLSSSDYDRAIVGATRNGHLHIINRLEDMLYRHGFNKIMILAIQNGHIHIVEKMVTLGANDFNKGIKTAAETGHLEIVKMMVHSGAKNFGQSIRAAQRHNNLDIATYLREITRSKTLPVPRHTTHSTSQM